MQCGVSGNKQVILVGKGKVKGVNWYKNSKVEQFYNSIADEGWFGFEADKIIFEWEVKMNLILFFIYLFYS